ncbi:MAG TPA: hypothetical protein VMP68_22840 [Candidatus Eisenbacteria bacterium]|nr:hypothetical protein [Candidatus Eisenbacteria bacterium]
MNSCQSCGAALAGNTRFCASCGSPTEIKVDVSSPADEGSAAIAVTSTPGEAGSKVMETNIVGALTYLAGFVTGIAFLVLDPYKSNSFVRFHAFQSIFFNVAWVAFWIVWMILSAVLTPLTAGVFGLIALPLMLIFTLAGFGIWIFLMYQAYQQRLFRLPIVGKFAAEHAGVRL